MKSCSPDSLLELGQALGIQMPWAKSRPSTSLHWFVETFGIAHRDGVVIFWPQLKTVGDAHHWLDHAAKYRPASEVEELKGILEKVLRFCPEETRPCTDFLGTASKVRRLFKYQCNH